MKVLDKVRVILYRCHEKGLEVLLIEPNLKKDPSAWKAFPKARLDDESYNGISIDSTCAKGRPLKAVAIEADWHQIPSLRGIIRHDVERLKSKASKCNYIGVKEAMKDIMPDEYAALKELKDIITDRNSLLSI